MRRYRKGQHWFPPTAAESAADADFLGLFGQHAPQPLDMRPRGAEIVKVASEGIPARSGMTIYSAVCTRCVTSPDATEKTLAGTDEEIRVFNFHTEAIPGNVYALVFRTISGTFYVICECSGCLKLDDSFSTVYPSDLGSDWTIVSGNWSTTADGFAKEQGGGSGSIAVTVGETTNEAQYVKVTLDKEKLEYAMVVRIILNYLNPSNYYYVEITENDCSLRDANGVDLGSAAIGWSAGPSVWKACIDSQGTFSVTLEDVVGEATECLRAVVTPISGGKKAGLGNGASEIVYIDAFELQDHYDTDNNCPRCCACPDLVPDDPADTACFGAPTVWRSDFGTGTLVEVGSCACPYVDGEFDLERQNWWNDEAWPKDFLWLGVLGFPEPHYPNGEENCWWQYGVCSDDPTCLNWKGDRGLINMLLFRKPYYYFGWDYWYWVLMLRVINAYDCAYGAQNFYAGSVYEYRSAVTSSSDCMALADPGTGKIQLDFYQYHYPSPSTLACIGTIMTPIYIWDADA